MAPAISTTDLRKAYGSVLALRGVDLEVPAGAFFGLLGQNGAGKTTFIKILVGLVTPTGGTAAVYGADVISEYQRARDRIGLAPQEFNVDRFFPIREVLMHKAGYHGVDRRTARRRADRLLEEVGIAEKGDTRFDWLSGGMKRRFMLARALITDPDLLILDEPTAGVDVQLRRDLWELITDLNDQGTTILLTTHYIEEAEALCDDVAILHEGQIIDQAAPASLTARRSDVLLFELDDTAAPIPPGLRRAPAIEAIERTDHGVQITTGDVGSALPLSVEALADAGITDVTITEATLEEIFVDLTAADEGGR
jgi:ABC-type multidrug transport system, ATPase component